MKLKDPTHISGREGTKFTARERFIIGLLAFLGIKYKIAVELLPDLVRCTEQYYGQLADFSGKILDALFPVDGCLKPRYFVEFNDVLVKRLVTGIYIYCHASVDDIYQTVYQVFGYHISTGRISEILKKAGEQALAFNESIPLDKIITTLTDEIFKHAIPFLTGIDADTRYAFLLVPASGRSGQDWTRTLIACVVNGLNPKYNCSDNGTGLRKGFKNVFPHIKFHSDVFHNEYGIGQIVDRIVRAADAKMTEIADLSKKISKGKASPEQIERYNHLMSIIDDEIERVGNLQTLYGWFKEHLDFNGYDYDYNTQQATWCLDEMAALFPKWNSLAGAVRKLKARLEDVLQFQQSLYTELRETAQAFGVSATAFEQLYSEIYRQSDKTGDVQVSAQTAALFGDKLADALTILTYVVAHIHRASSGIESFNSMVRPFLEACRGQLSEERAELCKMAFNTTKDGSRARADRVGTSPVERLTGQSFAETLDLLYGVDSLKVFKVA